jgi:uncharacterized membrane protein YvbJ
MKKKKEISTKKVIIISATSLIVVILGVSAYFIFEHSNRRDFRGGNFQPLNETVKNEITLFFGNSPSSSEIESYCKNNPIYCMYYCREINPSSEICSQIMSYAQPPGGKPQQ